MTVIHLNNLGSNDEYWAIAVGYVTNPEKEVDRLCDAFNDAANSFDIGTCIKIARAINLDEKYVEVLKLGDLRMFGLSCFTANSIGEIDVDNILTARKG